MTDADVVAMGGRGTFEGSLEVVVHGASLRHYTWNSQI